MVPSNRELLAPLEHFPQFDKGGNLLFYAHASAPKLRSIMTNGIRPRRGTPYPGSFFPDVVSLTAISNLPGSLIFSCNSFSNFFAAKARHVEEIDYDANSFYNFGIALNPKWIRRNILSFLGVGSHLVEEKNIDPKSGMTIYKLHALSNLPIRGIENLPNGVNPFPSEVHYKGDTLPSNSFGGIVIDEAASRFKEAKHILTDVVHELRDSSISLPDLAIYSRIGIMEDII